LTEPSSPPRSESFIVFLVAAVQFTNILDFVMVMPLGPDFAAGLGIPTSQLGLIGGSYTAAAAVSGLAGSFFLDRFDRRKALAVAMLGLVIGTAAGGLARGLGTLLLARVVAGAFGGPATSLAMSIIADVVPVQRRGTALSRVAMAFSVASVLGVPFALELSRQLGWRVPFFTVAGLGLMVAGAGVAFLPPLTGHLSAGPARRTTPLEDARVILARPEVRLSYLTTFTVMAGGFIIIPNISAYVQANLGYPREHLWVLYLAGGLASLASMQLVGRLVDRYGSFRIGTVGAVLLAATTVVGFVAYPPGFPVMGLFVGFMVANSFRNIAYNTLASRVPQPQWRARFMSFQSAIQHFASAAGATVSAWILTETPDHKLEHMPVVAAISIALTLCLPPLLLTVERKVRDREGSLAGAIIPPAAAR
jgi:predicted MFS family arabinose efflux permease